MSRSDTTIDQRAAELELLRDRFFKRARREALAWGEEALDLAWTYYPTAESTEALESDSGGAPRLVVDRVHLPRVGCESLDFITSVREDWWPARARVNASSVSERAEASDQESLSTKPDERESESVSDEHGAELGAELGGDAEVEAICAFYSRYLNASGFTFVIEFNHEHLADPALSPLLWRVDARAQGTQIVYPQDEGDVYDQLGAYLDLRVGWAWLLRQSEQRSALVTAEVEPGYLIGVRPGDPMSDEDPAEREDPEIEAVFSRFDAERFDTLEFLNVEEADRYPFQDERFESWLSPELSELLLSQRFEAFALSQSERFFEAIEEVAQRRKVEVSWDEDSAMITLRRGPVCLDRPAALPYLWTLHSGRQHYEGAVDFFRDDLDRVSLAADLYFGLNRIAESAARSERGERSLMTIEVREGSELLIHSVDHSGAQPKLRAQVPILDWAAESVFTGKDGPESFLRLWGWSSEERAWSEPKHQLDRCPICDREARVRRVIRPRQETEAQPESLGASFTHGLPQHLRGYYAVTCPQHQTPVFWESSERVQETLERHTHQVLDVEMSARVQLGEVDVELLWGEELAGELVDLNARESLRDRGALYAYALTPDLIALSLLPLDEEDLEDLAPSVAQLVARFGPGRDWPLRWHTPLL